MVSCPACREENVERARFCLACGAALTEATISPREERKLVSVLFCDLVGFTERSDHADPEDVRARLRTYHARLRTEIDRYGGSVEKFIGDAVMAVFGAPIAHEDDAERAVRAALRITEAIAELNAEHAALDLAVRVGVNTGEALVALDARPEHGEGMVAGDVVNTAARLQTVAPVDGVVVGEITYRATKDIFEYEELGPATLKGKAGSVPIWRAIAARSRLGVDVEQGTKTPFVGRANELQLLIQTFARTMDEGSVQLVTLTGEPGVGKTRILWELRAYVDDRPELIYWRQGRCLPYGEGVTFWALGEMVKGQAGILESDDPEGAMSKLDVALEMLIAGDTEREWLRARVTPLLGIGDVAGSGDRGEAFSAWRQLLEAIAARRPLVLVFEDLHWADATMLAFVEHLVDWSEGVPMLVVCSARPELYETHPNWGGGKRNSATIALPPLSEQDTARLIAALLDRAVLPAEVQSELLERAGGNPLYAEEFVRMLIDRGILERDGAAVRIQAPEGGIPLPENVHALIEARLDTLPPERKSLLQDASVVGKVFWSGALASMRGVEERTVREGLHELARKELVRATRSSSVEGTAEYSLWHALVRDVAYGQIPRAERSIKHLAAAAWIEGLAGERMADHAEFLAHHYERALELMTAAGILPDEATRTKAARFVELAGDRSAPLDVRKALEFYRRAESLLPADDPHGPILHVKTVEAADDLRDVNPIEVAAAFEAAIARLKEEGDTRAAGEMLARFSRSVRNVGQSERSDRLIDEAIELLEPLGPTHELAKAYATKAGNAMLAGLFSEWQRWTDRTFPLADELDLPDVRQRVLQYRGLIRIFLGDVDGLEDVEEALQLGLELGMGQDTASAYDNLADWSCRTRSAEIGLKIYREGVAFAERRGLGVMAQWMRAESTWPLFDMARWDEAVAVAQEVRAWYQGRGWAQPLVFASSQEAHIHLWRGQLDRTAELLAELLPAAREIGDVQALRPVLTAAARLEATRGAAPAAVALLEELEVDLGKNERARSYGMLDGVLVALRLGDVALAERIVGGTEPSPFPQGRLIVLTSRALVFEAGGKPEEALGLLEDVVDGWTSIGGVFYAAIARVCAARCLSALGRYDEAAQLAGLAGATFDAVRAVSLSVEAEGLVSRARVLGS